jgi:hypothetical protein
MGSVQRIDALINESMKIKQSLIINESMNKSSHVEKLCKTNRITAQEAEAKARFLTQRLNSPLCYKFYLKCVYHLSEAEIQQALEVATRPYVRCPAKYFSTSAKKLLIAKGF